MSMRRLTIASLAVALLTAASVASACSDDGDASTAQAGEAAAAVTQFFPQERDGGLLPEGVVDIVPRGVKTNSIKELDVSSQDKDRNVQARYCLEFTYVAQTQSRSRVYVAELIDGGWDVEAVNPNGTCEGVS